MNSFYPKILYESLLTVIIAPLMSVWNMADNSENDFI